MNEQVEPTTSDSNRDDEGDQPRGAPRPDISVVVELICAKHQVRGTVAYQELVQAAEDFRISVREAAAILVQSPDSI